MDAQLETTQAQKDYFNTINAHICSAETLADLEETEEELASLQLIKRTENKKKKPTATPYRTYFFEGFKIIAGRNNIQNERLTKSLSPDDL